MIDGVRAAENGSPLSIPGTGLAIVPAGRAPFSDDLELVGKPRRRAARTCRTTDQRTLSKSMRYHVLASMRYHVLACDYDHTLAADGRVDAATVDALRRARASGLKLLLVTGRELDSLQQVFPSVDVFDLVVAENGALLYSPADREERLLAEPPLGAFVAALRRAGVQPVSVGRAIVSTTRPFEPVVNETIAELGVPLEVIPNKDALMVLPIGVDKGFGLHAALEELALSPTVVAGIGDAENDLPFLDMCGLAVAVANALPEVKARVDLVTQGERAAGVTELLDMLLDGTLEDGRLWGDDGRGPTKNRERSTNGVGTSSSFALRPSSPTPTRIAIVANRGPNDFVWSQGDWVTRTASGGLVSMLRPLAREPGVVWFCCVSEPPDARRARRGLFTTSADQTAPELNVVPVPLPADVYHAYYGQISNEVLWMLQHRVVGHGGYDYLDHRRHRAWEEGYLEANRRLAMAIAQSCMSAEAFLVQDYHLYPLPALLRSSFPRTPILHFIHIPFPEVRLLKLLPSHWRRAILRGLLGADRVGLQTRHDVQAFLSCCKELLGAEVDVERSVVLAEDGREVAVRAYPASIDPDELRAITRSDTAEEARRQLSSAMDDMTIIRVDRLDPSKNQLIGFQAFARLLETRPDLRPRVQFLAFLVPSRTDLDIYRSYRDAVYRTIDRINARFTEACGRAPIRVFYENDRGQALAAMERCDALLINSREDGMNLVAKEWAVVSERPGVLVLSETAGVAEQVDVGALMISPLDIEGTAQALGEALDMPRAERAARLKRIRRRVLEWTNHDWLAAQLSDLGVLAGAPVATVR